MKMNQWVDFDTGDEAQSVTVFSYMGKTYGIELSLSVGFGDIWFANLYSVTGDKKQKCYNPQNEMFDNRKTKRYVFKTKRIFFISPSITQTM